MMATLSNEEAETFYKIMNELIYFANSRFRLVQDFPRPEKGIWKEEDIQKITEKIFARPEIIISFCSENPAMLKKEELEIASIWKRYVKDKFVIFSNNGKTIFFSSENEAKAYEVYGIYNDILEIIPFEPIIVEAILIPFKEKITFSGSFRVYNVSFGGGYRGGLKTNFQISKNKFGIITSLTNPVEEKKQTKEEILRFYLKSKDNRDKFWDEINKMLKEDPLLKNVYNNEIGKSYVRETKKIFVEIGIKSGWFAIVNSQIVASGDSEDKVKERLKEILPEDKLSSAHIFKYESYE